MRFFRIDSDALYEQVRLSLDAQWRHVPPVTCVDPAAVAPRDANGQIVLSVRAEFTRYDAVAAVLPSLLASGAVVEITRDEYMAAMPQETP